ncbi:MAG: sigma-70 family RNA polymerase sigma factor [Bacteroidales bacterium]|nr:sigma-70 family RNA polymerase sigma factor [Bacteroidales bacterium]
MCKLIAVKLSVHQTPTALPYHPVKYSEEQQLHGLRQGDNKVLGYIIKECRSAIRLMIHRMGGSEEDAMDTFHDALIDLISMCQDLSYALRSSIKTLLYVMCRNLWQKKLRRFEKEVDLNLEEIEDKIGPDFTEMADYALYEKLIWEVYKRFRVPVRRYCCCTLRIIRTARLQGC